MIEIYSTAQAATTGMTVTFNNTPVVYGNSATLNADNQNISLKAPGIYNISVNSTGTTTAAGNYGLQLMAGTTAIARATAAAAVGTGGNPVSVSFTALIKVAAAAAGNTASVNLQYTGAAGTIDLVNLVVEKVA